MSLAHHDRSGRGAEAADDVLDPVRGGFAEPAAMLAAVRADKFACVRWPAWLDDTEVSTAGLVSVYRPVEFDAQADQRIALEHVQAHATPAAFEMALAASCSLANIPRLLLSVSNASCPGLPRAMMWPIQVWPS